MYKHARALPKRGFAARGGATSSSVSNGPDAQQRQGRAAYNQRIEDERRRSRIALEKRSARGFTNLGKKQEVLTVWRLMVFDVPSHLGGLLARLSFRATKKNPKHWWRTFDPEAPGAHAGARSVLEQLNEAGLAQRRWSEVDGEMRR